jgi:hypothetical protein
MQGTRVGYIRFEIIFLATGKCRARLCGGGGDQRAAFLPRESKKAAR